MLERFPSEKLILHKLSGETIPNVVGLVDFQQIMIEDSSIVIEEGDYLERTLKNGAKEYYRVEDRGYINGMGGIPTHYQTRVRKVPPSEMEQVLSKMRKDENGKPNKIFISHSSKDKEYVEAFVELLEDIGLREDEIICSSIPPYCIPLNGKVYDWLVNEFRSSNLHVFYMLSNSYYASAACLNEMGAAWAMKQKWTAILLPGFGFNQISGCIDSTQISIKLDDPDANMLFYRLEELKNTLFDEFSIRNMSAALWERKRTSFISKIRDIQIKAESRVEENDSLVTATLTMDEGILLSYASDDDRGEVRVSMTLSRYNGPEIETKGYDFTNEDTPRVCARWKAALRNLENYGLIEDTGFNGEFFKVTQQGYEVADRAKELWSIDTCKSPKEYINQ